VALEPSVVLDKACNGRPGRPTRRPAGHADGGVTDAIRESSRRTSVGLAGAALVAFLAACPPALAADFTTARDAVVGPFDAMATAAAHGDVATARVRQDPEKGCRKAVQPYRPSGADLPAASLDEAQFKQLEIECVASARRANSAVFSRHVAQALAVDPGSLDQWEAEQWSPGFTRTLDWIESDDQSLTNQIRTEFQQAYEAAMGPRRKAAARHWADAIAATFAVSSGIEPPAALYLCASRKRNPANVTLGALFGMPSDPTAEQRNLDALQAKPAWSPQEAEAWITGTCRTMHDDTIAARVGLATAAANLPGTFGSGGKLGVPSHEDDRLNEIDPTALVQAAAIDGIQVSFRSSGLFSGPTMWITPFRRSSPRLDGKLEAVKHRDGMEALAIIGLQTLPGLDTPEDTIACLDTPLEQAFANVKARRLGGLAAAMFSDVPEEGGRAVANSFQTGAALEACNAAKTAFAGEPVR
jgi:hypothetical protein